MKVKKILKVLLIFIMLFTVFFINKYCLNKGQTLLVKDEVVLPKSSKYSISMWIKPLDNSIYNKIVKVSDNNSQIYLLNNAENNNYYSQGLTITWDNGNIYKSNDYKLDTGFYSNVIIVFNNKEVTLYLDGNIVLKDKIDTNLNNGNKKLKIFNEFEIEDITYYDYALSEKEVYTIFEENIDYKFETFINNSNQNKYPSEGGKYETIITPFKTRYESKSKDLEFNDTYISLNENKSSNDAIHNYQITITVNNKEYKKNLSIKQKGNNNKNVFDSKVQEAKNNINYYLSTSNKMEDIDGVDISYKVLTGNADYDNNNKRFVKLNNAKERELVEVECTVSNDKHSETFKKDFILLDNYVGYLMVFFNGEDGWPMHLTGDETLYFAFSKDLKNWEILNDKPIIKSNEGTGRFRDPYINRDKNANFIITCTEGYYNPSIYIIRTNDLFSFDTNHVVFNKYDSMLGLNGNKTWAPEFIYNKNRDLYTIVFSEGEQNNQGIYAVDTKDFINFSYPYLFLYTGYNSIDPDIALINGKYYLFYKDERENSKNIYYAKKASLDDDVWEIVDDYGLNGKHIAEGPFVIKNYLTNDYSMYLDGFKMSTAYSSSLTEKNNKLDANFNIDDSINNSIKKMRHFSIIPITLTEYNNISNYCKD